MGMEQREGRYCPRKRFPLVIFLHLGHLRQEPLEVVLVQHEAGRGLVVEVEFSLELRMYLDLALDQGMVDGESLLDQIKPHLVNV